MKTDYPTKKLGEMLELCDAGTWGDENSTGMPLLRSTNMQSGRLVLDDLKYIVVPREKVDQYTLREGDILITKSSGSVDHIGKSLFITKQMDGKYGFSNFTQRLRINRKIALPEWVYLKISDPGTRNFLLGASQTTTGLRNLKISALKELEIPVPSIGEQKKIVARIEKQFAKIDEAARLRAQNQALIAELLPSALHEIFFSAESKGWEEQALGEIVLEVKSGFACGKANEVANGVVHLRTHNVDLSGELNLNKIVHIPTGLVDKQASDLKLGDIIFNNTNSVELVGKSIIIREDFPYAFSNHLTRIRVDSKVLLPEWLLVMFQKYWREKVFENMCTRWIGQAGINQTALKKIKIPLPPLGEQKKIIKKLDALAEKIRALQELQTKQAADLKALKQSILHEVF